jgi:succinate dehydrogenase / fumarate reductase flavoprotein subunit
VAGEYQSKLTLMSESLRNDGRVWVPKKRGDTRPPQEIPEEERDYYLERKYPSYGNLAPRDIASRSAKEACDAGLGVGPGGLGVYLDFADSIQRLGEKTVRERYGNLFEMYENITGENAYERPMRIYPAIHYTMGGLWVDYNLMSNIPGLHVLGEANFSDHGANRLGASALMQGLADGYFVMPYTLGEYLSTQFSGPKITADLPEFKKTETEVRERINRLLTIKGTVPVDDFHRNLGLILWDKCGMARDAAGLTQAIGEIRALRERFWKEPVGLRTFLNSVNSSVWMLLLGKNPAGVIFALNIRPPTGRPYGMMINSLMSLPGCSKGRGMSQSLSKSRCITRPFTLRHAVTNNPEILLS